MNFNDWAPLKLVYSEFLKRIRLCYVFGETGHEALLVTDDDEVFACGPNFEGCLGLNPSSPRCKTAARIPELSKKKVKDNDTIYVCAYTYGGQIYQWGRIFNHSDVTETPTLIPSFSKKVVEVKCGADHCVALTADGEVYSWGHNDYGQLGHGTINVAPKKDSYKRVTTAAIITNRDSPVIVQGLLKGKAVAKISCGTNFSVAVLDNGEVYSWGSNNHGQLGVSDQGATNFISPNRVCELNGTVIKKITCGASYVMAVSDVGELFVWGRNDSGQLGLGDTSSRLLPTKVKELGKVIDIGSTSTGSTSAAMTESFKVYMWGYCSGLNFEKPEKTQFETLHEVFAYFGDPRVTFKPKAKQFVSETITDTLKNAFNNEENSDLTIVAEGKKIYVHKAILKMRSVYFKTMFQEPWVEDSNKEIELDQKYDAIYAYLEFVYTGNLKASPERALDLLLIAEEYQDLVLKEVSEKCIKYGITTENVADLYRLASTLNAKKLAKYCLTFASNHIDELIKSEGFREWDKETLIDFIIECQKRKMFKS